MEKTKQQKNMQVSKKTRNKPKSKTKIDQKTVSERK